MLLSLIFFGDTLGKNFFEKKFFPEPFSKNFFGGYLCVYTHFARFRITQKIKKFLRVFRGLFSKSPLNRAWGSAPIDYMLSFSA